MAEYTTEQLTALTQVADILASNGLTVKDLLEGKSLDDKVAEYQKMYYGKNSDFNELLYRILPIFYKEMVEQTSEEEAWGWVVNNILVRYTGENSEKWRDLLDDAGIRLKKYKVVEVTLSFKAVMPDEEYEGNWLDYADPADVSWEDADVETLSDDLSADSVTRIYPTLLNSVDELR